MAEKTATKVEEEKSTEEKVKKSISQQEKLPEDVAAAITADPQREVAPTEALQTLLDTLTSQRAQLRARKAKEEAQRSFKKAREEARMAAAAAKANREHGAPWRRPCVVPEELSVPGRLPASYLNPYQQQAVDRPAKTYEKHNGSPFLETSPYPYNFGVPPSFELSARQKKAKALSEAGKLAMSGSRSARASIVHREGSKSGAAGTTTIGPSFNPCGSPPRVLYQDEFLHDRLSGAITARI